MPKVSVIVPCYNEISTIRILLESLLGQTFPRGDMEVIIADGMSTDGTRNEIAAFQKDFPELDVQIVDNSLRSIPSGLNRAIEASNGGIIIRLDSHSKPYPDYIERCVAALGADLGDNVGGVWEIRPAADTWIASSIAAAAAHPLGVGDALYRHTKSAAFVDTVPFGSFKRELIAQVGYFDETLLTNEDYEFNARIRKAGGKIWLDPSIRSVYFSRATLMELARQYGRYGFWKWHMLRRYPDTIRWRQALPPLFVFSLLVLSFASLLISFAGLIIFSELIIYFLVLLVVGIRTGLKMRNPSMITGVPLAISVMHISWGCGFLWGILTSRIKKHGR